MAIESTKRKYRIIKRDRLENGHFVYTAIDRTGSSYTFSASTHYATGILLPPSEHPRQTMGAAELAARTGLALGTTMGGASVIIAPDVAATVGREGVKTMLAKTTIFGEAAKDTPIIDRTAKAIEQYANHPVARGLVTFTGVFVLFFGLGKAISPDTPGKQLAIYSAAIGLVATAVYAVTTLL